MKTYKAYCFDLDGTVYRGKAAIDSAVTFIHTLQQQGIEPYYLTNNSSKTREQLQSALLAIGIQAPLTHIYSSALATAKYVAYHYPQAKVKVIGSDGIFDAFADVPLAADDEQPDVLVMGIDRTMTYERLTEAALTVQRGAKLIGTNGDIKFPMEAGFAPGNGSLVRLVANVAGVEPLFIGKPSPLMLEIVAQEHHFTKEDMVMVGDNYDTDILCGIHFGCDTIHVDTGVTRTADVLLKPMRPTYMVPNLLQLN